MEGIVAKRTLKKSYYENKKNNNNNLILKTTAFNNTKEEKNKEKNRLEKYKEKILYKFYLQLITVAGITIFILAIKHLNVSVVLESDISKKIINYYEKNYSIEQIVNGGKHLVKSTYIFIKPIIPKQIEEKTKKLYKILLIKEENNQKNDIEIEKEEVKIYEEANNYHKENTFKESVGVSIDVKQEEEEKVIAVSSSISSEKNIVDAIKKTKIKFIKPVSGTITSHFGAREVIFEGIDSYHTGTDIATNKGTKVVSSIEGKVTRATYNKYNGNFVEVKNGDIATIYCHMNKLSVKVGDLVKSGTKIGEVGSTGLSTGPHLHFEIVYDGTKVDPELILDL